MLKDHQTCFFGSSASFVLSLTRSSDKMNEQNNDTNVQEESVPPDEIPEWM